MNARILSALLLPVVATFSAVAQGGFPQRGPGGTTGSSDASPPMRMLPGDWTSKLRWRTIGPSVTGGRIVDLAVNESDPANYYIASASGGLWKTTNNGVTVEPVFEKENTVSLGDAAVAPSDPRIVWVGTGEHNARNSASWGDGVYKSTDAGKTWKNMGLERIFQTGRIAIHPKNPDIVYVGALGRLWGPNPERGVYRTKDGGKTWDRVLFVDDKTGCIDLVMNPANPNELFAAMYERLRDPFDGNDPVKRHAPGSGLYKTTDGGATWKKCTNGLPTVNLGRIGLTYFRKNPRTLFAVVESEKIGTGPTNATRTGTAYMGLTGENADGGAKLLTVIPEGPADSGGLRPGDIITTLDGKKIESYEALLDRIRDQKPQDKVKFIVKRDDKPQTIEVTLGQRPQGFGGGGGGGGGGNNAFAAQLGGQNANVQERQGKEGFQTGGVYKSTDGGEKWERINSLNPRPFYFSKIHVDPNDDKFIFVLGISLHMSTDGGKTFRSDAGRSVHADHHAMWINPRDGRHIILGGDGGFYETHDRAKTWEFVNTLPLAQFYHVAVDSRRLYRVYGGLQDNGTWAGPSMLRSRTGPTAEDWLPIGGGDGFMCAVDRDDPDLVYFESQNGVMGRVNIRTGERGRIRPEAPRGSTLRFNWKTPFTLSAHNAKVFYCGAQFVYRSLDRGEKLRQISPELTRTRRGTLSALSESPLNPDVLWAGTDDGWLWITKDGGHTWNNLTANLKDIPGPRWVSTIEASRFKEGRCYVTFDGHRSDDDKPWIFATEDFGATWRPLMANLPEHTTRCLREDIENPNLLFLGTEFGVWTSVDRGQSWSSLKCNMPTVAVHDFAISAKAGELVAASHGRGLWIHDLALLRQVTKDTSLADVQLFKPQPATLWAGSITRRYYGEQFFTGQNPAAGANIFLSLPKDAKQAALKITDTDGKLVRDLPVRTNAGLQVITWDLRRARTGGGPGGGFGGLAGGGGGRGPGAGAEGAGPQATPQRPAGGPGGSGQGKGRPGGAQAGQARGTNAPPAGAAGGLGGLFSGRGPGDLFDRLDTDKNGTLTPDEINTDPVAAETLQRFGLDPTQSIARDAMERAVQETMGRLAGGAFGRPVETGRYRLELAVDGVVKIADLHVHADPDYPEATTMLQMQEEEFFLWLRKRGKTAD